jgi:putative endonuclease
MSHFVYMLHSESYDVYYKGESSRPYERLIEHNENLSDYGLCKGPWKRSPSGRPFFAKSKLRI